MPGLGSIHPLVEPVKNTRYVGGVRHDRDMDTNPLVMLLIGLTVGIALGILAGALFGITWRRARILAGTDTDQAGVREGLARLHDQLRDLEHSRSSWQGQLNQQVVDMRMTTESLRRETQTLSTALRKPQVRGRWGEMHLRRAIELAGMVERCDFTEQLHLAGVDGGAALRPDLVVHLAGGKHLAVDAKVPLEAFLDAAAATDDDERARHLQRHAQQLRRHIDGLARKRYWRALDHTPEFVVMFVPADAFLAAALEADQTLLEYAADHQVVLASPTTLIALLRTVAHGWTHETLGEQAAEIHRLGRELHERLAGLGRHFDHLGRSLNAAVGHYNQAMGSWESRVLVSARRFTDLQSAEDLPSARQVETTTRAIGNHDVTTSSARHVHGV
jgi:DNA recombination protein RmuC